MRWLVLILLACVACSDPAIAPDRVRRVELPHLCGRYIIDLDLGICFHQGDHSGAGTVLLPAATCDKLIGEFGNGP